MAVSPSSRRAWIEIIKDCANTKKHRSPSSRRAWIEIALGTVDADALYVALLAEGVDRNLLAMMVMVPSLCRPPRGGRG